MAIAWLLTVAVAAVIYFVPMTRLVDRLSDHPATITAHPPPLPALCTANEVMAPMEAGARAESL